MSFQASQYLSIVVPISRRLMVDHGEPLLCAAVAGIGLLLQPLELVREALAAGDRVTLLADYPVPARPFHVLYVPDRRMTPKLKSFLDLALAEFAENPAGQPSQMERTLSYAPNASRQTHRHPAAPMPAP